MDYTTTVANICQFSTDGQTEKAFDKQNNVRRLSGMPALNNENGRNLTHHWVFPKGMN